MSAPLAFYNEIDPKAAAWLRVLIAEGHIAPGEVDERDIRDVRPDELVRFTQCHFFAGIGVWSYAARRAGWPDSRPLWSASLPCQPWSAAGQGKGFGDERHLWPTFEALRLAIRPVVAVGEQVASKDGLAWLDAVQADVEASGDAFGAVDLCSAGFGAPHIRQRLHWVAYATGSGGGAGLCDSGSAGERGNLASDGSAVCGMADASRGGRGELGDALVAGCRGHADSGRVADRLDDADDAGLEGFRSGYQAPLGRVGEVRPTAETGEFGGLADVHGDGRDQAWVSVTTARDDGAVGGSAIGRVADADVQSGRAEHECEPGRREPRTHDAAEPWRHGQNSGPGPVNGLWRTADWLACRDDKWRPVESGTFPLAHGAPARVGRLRGYGNAINAEVATAFIEAVMDHLEAERLAA